MLLPASHLVHIIPEYVRLKHLTTKWRGKYSIKCKKWHLKKKHTREKTPQFKDKYGFIPELENPDSKIRRPTAIAKFHLVLVSLCLLVDICLPPAPEIDSKNPSRIIEKRQNCSLSSFLKQI